MIPDPPCFTLSISLLPLSVSMPLTLPFFLLTLILLFVKRLAKIKNYENASKEITNKEHKCTMYIEKFRISSTSD